MSLKDLKVAEDWQSFRDLLSCILETFNPKTVIEFGSGWSTGYIASYPSVKCLVSVEDKREFYEKIPNKPNVTACLREDSDSYRDTIYYKKWYDLVFIDGKERQGLLSLAPERTGLVLLHDASRGEYRKYIEPYKYKLANDAMCTLALTNTKKVFETLKGAYALRSRDGQMWYEVAGGS